MTQTPDSSSLATDDHTQVPPEITEQEHLGMLSLEISVALNGKETLYEMLKACTETLAHHLAAPLARIWLWTEDEADDVLELLVSSGSAQRDAEQTRLPVQSTTSTEMSETTLIATQRQPRQLLLQASGQAPLSHGQKNTLQQWAQQQGVTAFAGYPLLIREQLVGVLEIFTRRPLSPTAFQTLAAVCNGIAMSIERQQLLEERTRLLQREYGAHVEAEIARQRLQDLFMQAPAIICVLRGPQHVYEMANPLYMQIVGRNDIIGKTVREASPELVEQGYETLLDQVYKTGEPFIGKELPAKIYHSESEKTYFNFVYQPTRASTGEVDGILIHAIDVTEQVLAREKLKNNQERLELAQRSGHIGTFDWRIAVNQILWTPELEALYGLPPNGFEGKYENWARRVHPDDLPAAEENIRQAIAGGPPYDVEFRVIWPDGTQRWIQGKGNVDYDEQGQPWRMIGVNIDITERKEAELQLIELNSTLEVQVALRTEALNQTNLELQRSNNELQEFAYVASHDLQEPLRKIQAFGNLLIEEYGEAVGEGQMYIERMRNAASRMRILIEDLLAFSRVTTKAQPFVQVDLNEVARQVVDDLGPRLESTHGVIELGALPTLSADQQQMYQMLQNLLGNAVKFHKPDLPPLVKVSSEVLPASTEPDVEGPESEACCVIRIEDNGIGFDEKYTDRIFTVFQRLHGKDKYEGTGIGLAVVRKIVERHGGTIVASSTPGEGATFLVTLPLHYKTKEIEA
jgi:PAS domain S-box-containing protein